ncbi:MAG: MaoC family dehydratase [Gemmatimonadaceae bacterium]|nr:MaoC family dehydratase [Gemmatimonadaceae bacterium]
MRFDELAVGQRAQVAKAITQDDIVRFAELTGDDNPVHLDEAVAAQSRFGRRIAHGMLSAGLISAVLGTKLPGPGVIYLSQSLRFTRPVHPGDVITATAELVELIPAKRRARLATTCRNQADEVVLEGEALVMVPDDSP